MKILRFDSVGGASGDMILGALIDLGVDAASLTSRLKSLPVGDFRITAGKVTRNGLRGTQAVVETIEAAGHAHHHRDLEEITRLISISDLPESVKNSSMAVFRRLAEAEGAVHGISPEKVHFHEVGAVDSIVDIVGSCLAVESLGVDAVTTGPLPIGQGTVDCVHGVLPVPVPAVTELLKGHSVVQTDEPFELVTPTGAALLTTWQMAAGKPAGNADRKWTILKSGCGFGQRELYGRPNMIRAILLEATSSPSNTDECVVLECNVDDTVPELLGSLAQSLMEKGALDVFMTPIQMKKQRPGTMLTVLCRPDDKPAMLDLIFRESTTFGVREHMAARTTLERRHEEVETPYGKVRMKIGRWQGRDVTRAPEHDDCARCARAKGVPVRTVYEAAQRA